MRSDSYKCSEIESLALRILNLPQAPLSLAKILPFIDTFLHSVQPIQPFLSAVTKMILKLPLNGKNDEYGPASSVRWLLLMVTDRMILLYVPLALCILTTNQD